MSSERVTVNQTKQKLLVLRGNTSWAVHSGYLVTSYMLRKLCLYLKQGVMLFDTMLMYEMTKYVGYWKQFKSNSGNGCSTSQGVLGHTWYSRVHHRVLQGTSWVTRPGIAGYTTGQRGMRPAPSLPPRFLNTSTLQLETLQHTLK